MAEPVNSFLYGRKSGMRAVEKLVHDILLEMEKGNQVKVCE
jgi:hypothetical protein